MPRPSPVPTRPEDILRAARTVFARQGFLRARIADIAAQAQVATGTVYLYYSSKEAIVAALVEDYFTRLTTLIQPFADMADTPTTMAEACHRVLGFVSQERDLLKLARLQMGLNKEGEFRPGPAHMRFLETFSRMLQTKMEEHHYRSYDPQALAELIDALFVWIADVCFVRGVTSLDRYEQTLTDLLVCALLPQEALS
jgi:AcrR family transcriptional regulator